MSTPPRTLGDPTHPPSRRLRHESRRVTLECQTLKVRETDRRSFVTDLAGFRHIRIRQQGVSSLGLRSKFPQDQSPHAVVRAVVRVTTYKLRSKSPHAVRRIKMLRGIACAAVAVAVAPPRSPATTLLRARRVVRSRGVVSVHVVPSRSRTRDVRT